MPVFSVSNQSSKPQLRVARILPSNGLQPLGTAAVSSLTGSITISLHGHEIKMRVKSESMQSNHVFEGPHGEMRWKSDKWGKGIELVDAAGVKIAHYDWMKMRGEPRLDIFVQSDPFLVELTVIGAVAKMYDDQKGWKMVGKLVEAVAGA